MVDIDQLVPMNVAYRWFLGYSLLDRIPHFATVSYAFCKRFPSELPTEIFEHILNKAINNRAVDPSAVFIDGTHIKASANKKKFQKEQVAKTAKIYEEQLRKEVNAERAELGKSPIDDDEDDRKGGGTAEKTVSTTDPDCGMFVKGEHERQFAYEAHTACDKNGMVLIELSQHVPAAGFHQAADAVAPRGVAGVAAVQVAGWVRGDPFEQQALALAGIVPAVIVTGGDNVVDDSGEGALPELEADEAGAGDGDRLALREKLGKLRGKGLCNFHRVTSESARKLHGNAGGIIAQLGVLRGLNNELTLSRFQIIDLFYGLLRGVINLASKVVHANNSPYLSIP